MNKAAHRYDPSTLIYTHSTALYTPLGYDEPLKPQCSSLAPLPEYDRSTQELKIDLTDDKWIIINKAQKVTAYHKQTQEPKELEDQSNLTDEYTLQEPPTPYHDFKVSAWEGNTEKATRAKREEINLWRSSLENDEYQVVKSLDSDWDAGPSARLRIDSILLTGHMPPYWTDANNVDHQGMTIDELKQVKIAISELGFAIHDRQRTMKKEVEALTDFNDILNYPVGWPEE